MILNRSAPHGVHRVMKVLKLSLSTCLLICHSPLPMLRRLSLSLRRALSLSHALSLTLLPYSLTRRGYVAPFGRLPTETL